MLNSKKMVASMALAAVVGMGIYPTTTSAMTQQQAQQIINARNAQLEIERQIVSRYNAGLQAYTSGNYNGCIQNLMVNAVANKFQGKKDYNVALGDSFFHLQNYNQAITFLQRSYNIGGGNLPLVNIDLGMSFYTLGNYQQAANFLQRGINSNLANGDTLWALAVSYDKIGNANGMVSTMETIIARYPNYNKDIYITVGMAYLDKNNVGTAFKVFQKGLQYFQNDADLLYWAGHTCFLDGNYEGAIPYLEKSNQLLPNNIDTLYDLGASYLAYDRLDEAAACADIMVKVDKNHAKTQDLYKAVQQKIMQRQMEQQMQMDMINQQMQETQNAADMGINAMPAGMMN